MKSTHGPVTVNYYHTPTRGYDSYTIVWRTESGRKTIRKPSKAEAKKFADDKAVELAEGFKHHISSEDRASISRARELIRPTGKPLELVAGEYAEAHQALPKDVPIAEAVRFFNLYHAGTTRRTVAQVKDELVASLKDRSEAHVYGLTLMLKTFAKSFSCGIAEVTGKSITEWIDGLGVGPRSKLNHRTALSNLFNFAKRQKYLPAFWDELKAVPVPKVPKSRFKIFTPEEMGKMLAAADKKLRLFVAVSAFAGLRNSEATYLLWEDVKFEQRKILVRDERKTGKRTAPITDNLLSWLEPARKKSGPVASLVRSDEQLMELGAVVGGWRRNGPRSSFISYRTAQIKDPAAVAFEAGNSADTIKKHYLEVELPDGRLIGDTEAKQWFDLVL